MNPAVLENALSSPSGAPASRRSIQGTSAVLRGGLLLAALLVLSVTVRAQNPAEVSQIPIPILNPGEVIIGLEAEGPALHLFTNLRRYESPLYPASDLVFTPSVDTWPGLGLIVNVNSWVARDPTTPGRFYIAAGSRGQFFLYTLTLSSPIPTSTPISGLGGAPDGIAVDAEGDIYLSNVSSQTVAKYAPGAGTPILTFDTSGAGTLTTPTALAAGPDGRIYVLDTGANRIVSFDKNGLYQSAFPLVDTTDPDDLEIGLDGRLYTANGNGGGAIYDIATGLPVGTMTPASGEPSDAPGSKTQLEIGGNYLYLFDESTGLHVYELPTPNTGNPPGNMTLTFSIYNQGRAAALPSHARAYLADRGDALPLASPRTTALAIQRVSTSEPGCSSEDPDCTPALLAGSQASYTGTISAPPGGFGRLALTDLAGNAAAENPDGTFVLTSSSTQKSAVSFLWGRYLWVEADGARNQSLQKLDEAGQQLPVLLANDRRSQLVVAAGAAFGELSLLRAVYEVAGGGPGGPLRLDVHLEGHGKIAIRLGGSPSFLDAETSSGVNLIGNNDAGRYDTSGITNVVDYSGSASTTYSDALAAAGSLTVARIDLVADDMSGPLRTWTLHAIEPGKPAP